MRNTYISVLAALCIVCLPLQSYADKGGKGPGEHAYEHANDNASFKREEEKAGNTEHKRDTDSDSVHDHEETPMARIQKKKGNDGTSDHNADSGVKSGDKKKEK